MIVGRASRSLRPARVAAAIRASAVVTSQPRPAPISWPRREAARLRVLLRVPRWALATWASSSASAARQPPDRNSSRTLLRVRTRPSPGSSASARPARRSLVRAGPGRVHRVRFAPRSRCSRHGPLAARAGARCWGARLEGQARRPAPRARLGAAMWRDTVGPTVSLRARVGTCDPHRGVGRDGCPRRRRRDRALRAAWCRWVRGVGRSRADRQAGEQEQRKQSSAHQIWKVWTPVKAHP